MSIDNCGQTTARPNHIFISLFCNILLVIVKGVTGLLANSNALVADAAHSLSDVIVFFVNYHACRECAFYRGLDKQGESEKIMRRIADIGNNTSFYTGVFFFIVGMAVCFHNFVVLVLGKSARPEMITLIVAFISLGVYAWIYRYSSVNAGEERECGRINENTYLQNKLNLFSGAVVAAGLIGGVSGLVFMDELAALIVGSIVLAMGLKLMIAVKDELSIPMGRYLGLVIPGCFLAACVVAGISLAIQLSW